ncbi:MAG: tRNA (adenosine(37)-N6)-threonylcarbamoyltransferase complex ATPase subunit type 1 TsaE [Chitinophagaceae bacterium]|nr:tRNA (adenosine(37)-N6)-threonylcarbamoyltransferase complex ATPase subunit type 1 TsaE [Chitinophagaceae bacterium]
MEMVYNLTGISEAAKNVLETIKQGKVVAFEGEMGTGKTTLIQAMCRELGVKGSMGSPTFSIINEYASGKGTIFHIDLYRCNSEEEAVRAGVEECLYSGHLCLAEWPSKAEGIFPEDTIRLSISLLDAYTRKIIVNCKK